MSIFFTHAPTLSRQFEIDVLRAGIYLLSFNHHVAVRCDRETYKLEKGVEYYVLECVTISVCKRNILQRFESYFTLYLQCRLHICLAHQLFIILKVEGNLRQSG